MCCERLWWYDCCSNDPRVSLLPSTTSRSNSGRVFEAGFFAGATFYMTLFYTRGEMGFRLAIMQSFAVLASAFSGLISFGVFQIHDPAVKGWQWLFIIEGSMTFLMGIMSFFWLPGNPRTAWFLNERERAAATARLLRDT